jgi:murein DD-endopeptidase MepM/ murein hydrolase activator NlpD
MTAVLFVALVLVAHGPPTVAGAAPPVVAPAPVGVAGAEDPRRPAGRYRWPLDGTPTVLRRFDPPPKPWLAGHRGVDLAAAPGAHVLAPAAGIVVYVGTLAGRGVVSVGHANGLRTTYEPVEAGPELSPGDPVVPGEQLGTVTAGHPGCPTGCLHWGLRRGDTYLDPLALLGLGRVRLLPLDGPGSAQ